MSCIFLARCCWSFSFWNFILFSKSLSYLIYFPFNCSVRSFQTTFVTLLYNNQNQPPGYPQYCLSLLHDEINICRIMINVIWPRLTSRFCKVMFIGSLMMLLFLKLALPVYTIAYEKCSETWFITYMLL
jgi:hypothetical protein